MLKHYHSRVTKANHFLRIPTDELIGQNSQMGIDDYRRRNLAVLIKLRYKSQADFSRKYGIPPPNVNALLRGDRSFGGYLARRFEAGEELRPGWLDEEIPLTDEALSIARRFMQLNAENAKNLVSQMNLLQRSQSIGVNELSRLQGLHESAINQRLAEFGGKVNAEGCTDPLSNGTPDIKRRDRQ
jgi:hypothetical protein